jgi:hypothetical protein
MMNVLELQDKLKNFSEDQLVNEMQQPSGNVPQYLVLSEINRRKRVRDDYQQQQQGQQSNMTVAQEKLAAAGMPQEGLAGLAESMAPQTDMTMNTGATPDQTMPLPEAPAPMAEAQPDMAGGIASMAKGGYVRRLQVGGPPGGAAMSDPAVIAMANRAGMSVQQYLESMSPEEAARVVAGAEQRAERSRMMALEPIGDSVTLPTQADLDRKYKEEQFAFGASRPMTPPADTDMPTLPSVEEQPSLASAAPSMPSIGEVFDARVEAQQADRTFGQRYIGDPLRNLFQPIGEAAREFGQPIGDTLEAVGQPIGDSMSEALQPVGADLTQVLEGRPQEGYAFVPPRDPRLVPQPLTYDQIISRARSGSMPSLDQLQSSVEAGLLTSQQSADVQAMTEGTGYMPDSQEVAAANSPGMSPVIPDDPRLVTDPFLLQSSRTQAGQTIDDYLAGMFGGRSVQEQLDINAARSKAIEETVSQGGDDTTAASEANASPQAETNQGLSFGLPSIDTGSVDTGTLDVGAGSPKLAFGNLQPGSAATTPSGTRTSGSSGGSGGSGGAGSVDSQIIEMLKEREKRAENDKWLALAQAGMALMSSTQPTLGGALGEAGAEGLKAFRASRDEYDSAKMDLLKTQQAMAKARASGASSRDYNNPTAIGEAINLFTKRREDLLGKTTKVVTDNLTGEQSYETVYKTREDLSPEGRTLYDSLNAEIARLTKQYAQFFPADMTQ